MATVQQALDQIWSDDALKQRLLSDPKPILTGFGLEFPENVTVHVHENTSGVFNAVLPTAPDSQVPAGTDPLSRLIVRAWSDEAFKHRLLTEPKEAAAEMGLQMPAGVQVKVWENTAKDYHIVLPANPVETELSEMELEAVSGGTSKTVAASPLPACIFSGPAPNEAGLLLKNAPALTGTPASSPLTPSSTKG